MEKGVVIIAAGHAIYGQMALNLCMSIKNSSPNMKVALFYHGKGATHIEHAKYLFDYWEELPASTVITRGRESMVRPKVCLYELTPFDETIFIDADVILFPQKSIDGLFDELKDVDFTIGSRGKAVGSIQWMDGAVEGDYYNLSSEFIYFKKTDYVKAIFKKAKKVYDNPPVGYKMFAGTVPDELAFQIAMNSLGVKPHQEKFLPFYWEPFEKKIMQLPALYKTQYYGYSMGGNTYHSIPKNNYDTLAKYYANRFGLRYHYPAQDKRSLMPNRNHI